MKRWWVAALIFVAGTAIGGTVAWSVSNGNDSGGTNVAAQKSKSKLSAPAQELLDRLDAGEKSTYHVRYTYGSESGTHLVMEVWHSPDRVRRDLLVVSPTQGTSRTQEFLQKGELVRCVLVNDNPWQCVANETQAASLRDPLNGANRDVDGKTVAVTETTIAGHAARCYEVAASGATASTKPMQYCLSAENAPLRIDGGDGKPVEASDYDLTVPDSVFTYPAKVAGLAST